MAVRLAKEGRHPVKAITRALGVARSNVLAWRRERPAPAPQLELAHAAESPENEAILSEVRALVNVRASYGYRRITALLNRARKRVGQPRVNPKRIYRLVKREKLLLERCTGDRPVASTTASSSRSSRTYA